MDPPLCHNLHGVMYQGPLLMLLTFLRKGQANFRYIYMQVFVLVHVRLETQ